MRNMWLPSFLTARAKRRAVIAAGPNNLPGPAQVAYWQPGDTHLCIATIRNLGEITQLQTGSLG